MANSPAAAASVPRPCNSSASDERRATLLTMLEASESRRSRLVKKRLPALAPGVKVGFREGQNGPRVGVIVDADFIQNRVLINTEEADAPIWIAFRYLVPAPDDN